VNWPTPVPGLRWVALGRLVLALGLDDLLYLFLLALNELHNGLLPSELLLATPLHVLLFRPFDRHD
jgi:hypothetical protein